jgi:hypothetical protein
MKLKMNDLIFFIIIANSKIKLETVIMMLCEWMLFKKRERIILCNILFNHWENNNKIIDDIINSDKMLLYITIFIWE